MIIQGISKRKKERKKERRKKERKCAEMPNSQSYT